MAPGGPAEARSDREGEQGNTYDAIRRWHFIAVLEAHQGNALTPVEDFIVNLPQEWILARQRLQALTPDDIVNLVNARDDGPRAFFDDAVEISRQFRRLYRKSLDEADAKELQEAQETTAQGEEE